MACRMRSSCSCDPRLRRPVRGSSGLAPATQGPIRVWREEQRVLAHEGVADDPQEDAEARETGDDGEEGDQRIAEWPSGREDRSREATDEAEQAHAQPKSQEEPTPSDSAPGEVESAEEDEDAAEVRREAQQGEQDEDDEDRRGVGGGGDVIPVDPRDAAGRGGALRCGVGDLPAEEGPPGGDGGGDPVPGGGRAQAPP